MPISGALSPLRALIVVGVQTPLGFGQDGIVGFWLALAHSDGSRSGGSTIGHEHALRQPLAGHAPPVAGTLTNAPPFAALDIELFERAVANLIDNALKFCPRGARITLGFKTAARERDPVGLVDRLRAG